MGSGLSNMGACFWFGWLLVVSGIFYTSGTFMLQQYAYYKLFLGSYQYISMPGIWYWYASIYWYQCGSTSIRDT